MGFIQKMGDSIRRGLRSWLNITPSNPYGIQINEVMDFELSAIRNRIWYRGDGNELEQMYQQTPEYADRFKFWACRSTPGMEIRKIHTGLPGMIVRILNSIVVADMNDFLFESPQQDQLWKEIEKENKFRKKFEKSLKEVLYIGDGAYKITVDTGISPYPILEWYPGDRVEYVYHRDRIKEVVFKTPYECEHQQYILYECYGYGYIKNELYRGNQAVPLNAIDLTKDLKDWAFDPTTILAVPLQIYENTKFEGRGGSIFDGKLDCFDAFDEAWSQWMDALRAGRARTYIPESYIPRDPHTGEFMKPNPFDNRFIQGANDMSEGAKNEISTEQPDIPHDSYLASYCTALDQCLQGLISPSTLGIDVKKLDNAEAQREKEKATLYTRQAIVEALQETLPDVVAACINAFNLLNGKSVEEVKVDIPFGEYANPSFESLIETLAKARPGSPIMSIEAQVEELYGDKKDPEWKEKEVLRLKQEVGIEVTDEPSVAGLDGFQQSLEEPESTEEPGDPEREELKEPGAGKGPEPTPPKGKQKKKGE